MKTSIAAAVSLTNSTPPTTNKHLIRWVEKMADLCRPESIHWVDGSQAEYEFLCDRLVAAGTYVRLNQERWPGCFYARSAPGDVARVKTAPSSARSRAMAPAPPTIGKTPT